MTDETVENLEYASIKNWAISQIESYKSSATEQELNNRFVNVKKKSDVIFAFNQLNEDDKPSYEGFINKVKNGGSPIITGEKALVYDFGTEVDLYSLIKAVDNEDGKIEINSDSTEITTSFNKDIAGTYEVVYRIKDSSNNISSYTIAITIEKNPSEPIEKPTEPSKLSNLLNQL